ncbi:MAG TPA: efflux RND transporter periplasmic adaptor subunit [Lacunisphaera sp.]|jgi:RND family efflux transporter MFP subunit|nr:efflux RND transporter periplasmic adaptor subunit [Lacunisphaera sp.]
MNLRLPLLSVAVLAAFTGCSRHEAAAGTAAALPPARVRLVVVHTESVPVLTEITGAIRPVRRATLAAKLMGAIDELPVALGQRVSAGDLLLRISAAEISARLAQAQAGLDQVQRDLARERDLLPKHASTAEMVRNLETRATVAEAQVREAQTMLGYAELRAPFDGFVARKYVEAGDLASPGMPLIELEGTDSFQVEAGIPDSLAGSLTVGTPVEVDVASAHVTFAAPLAELSSAADPNAHTVTAKFTVPAGLSVRSGQFARLQIPGAPVRVLLAPAAAVSIDGQMERVFVAGAGNRAELRLVKTGAARGDRVEILSGLDDGERVVLAPPAGLREGQPLEATP